MLERREKLKRDYTMCLEMTFEHQLMIIEKSLAGATGAGSPLNGRTAPNPETLLKYYKELKFDTADYEMALRGGSRGFLTPSKSPTNVKKEPESGDERNDHQNSRVIELRSVKLPAAPVPAPSPRKSSPAAAAAPKLEGRRLRASTPQKSSSTLVKRRKIE